MRDDRPVMSRPLRDLLSAMRPAGCVLQHPGADRGVAGREAQALAWHRNKHAADAAHGWRHVSSSRLQIAHVRDWPTTKAMSAHLPRLIAERRFHCLDNVLLLCPEAHDLYDGASLFSRELMQNAAWSTWTLPQAREPLRRYLQATADAHRGHQTENTSLYIVAEYLRSYHGVDAWDVVKAFEARARLATASADRGDSIGVHRGQRAVFRMLCADRTANAS